MSREGYGRPEASAARVGVHAPLGRDAALICRFLREDGIDCVSHDSFHRLLSHAENGVGPVILTEHALGEGAAGRLLEVLKRQPSWSDLPVMILSGTESWPSGMEPLVRRQGVTVLDRPLTARALRTLLDRAMDAWTRQLQVRDLLRELQEANAELANRADQLQRLTRELTEAEHRERKRISKWLHDDLQQHLVASRMRLEGLRHEPGARIQEVVGEVEKLLDGAVESSRSLATDLSPPFLHDAAPAEVLRWVARRVYEQHGLAVRVAAREDVPKLREELNALLHEAARELLFNVVKHAEVGEATVELHHDAEGLTLAVEDPGQGFEDASGAEAENPGGSLGLFRLRERVGYLGGELSIRSEPGEGTRIEIRLPSPLSPSEEEAVEAGLDAEDADGHNSAVSTPPAAASADAELPDGEAGEEPRLRILLVEDHAVVREGIRTLLEPLPDLEVVGEAVNGVEAVERARELRPDIVLMDISMPEMDGVEATRRITDEQTCGSVVGLSMHRNPEMVKKMHDAGARAYLTKEKAKEQLVDVVRGEGRSGPLIS